MRVVIDSIHNIIAGVRPEDVAVDIDNGHGTRLFTAGKCSSDGRYYEGEWSRMMAPRLASALQEIGFKTNIIVPEDQDIPRMERCRRANELMAKDPAHYHIFVSLHTNAVSSEFLVNGWNKASGLVVYVCEKCSAASMMLAKNVYEAGAAMGLRGNRSVPDSHYWKKNWDVITYTKMPAILTESCFHTNKDEVDYLLSAKGQEDIINFHVAGICKTFGIPYSLCIG